MSVPLLSGVLTPVVTPYNADLSPDAGLMAEHCAWLIENGSGLAVFGTNSEGNSLGLAEKRNLLDVLVKSGIDPARMMPGNGACALPEAVELTRHAVELGCGGVLTLPPFYYKGVPDEGLFRFFADMIEAVGDDRLRIYLYHIPPVAQVGFSLNLIARLIEAFPGIVVGIKDSSGDFSHTKSLLERFPGWGVFCGNEVDLAEAMGLGAVGCISATCNINAGPIVELSKDWDQPDAGEKQAAINAVRKTIAGFPMIPALKAVAARFYDRERYAVPRPPLMPLSETQKAELFSALDALDYAMRRG